MTRSMDLTQLDAIDVHVHVEQDANAGRMLGLA